MKNNFKERGKKNLSASIKEFQEQKLERKGKKKKKGTREY